MYKKALYFVKYNNATVLILVVIFVLGTGVWAQTEPGQEFIGAKEIKTEGVDNTLLLEADLDAHDMDYTIERIESDEDYYYATYTYLDIVKHNNAWQYLVQEGVRKVSKNLKKDLGKWLAEELSEESGARSKELKEEQLKARQAGAETRVEISEYSGLIGSTLDLVAKVFPNYEPVKKQEIPSPSIPPALLLARFEARDTDGGLAEENSANDSFSDVYDKYVAENDPDHDDWFGSIDNCPADYNPDQADRDEDGLGDVCDSYPDDALNGVGEIATGTEEVTGTGDDATTDTTTDTSSDASGEPSGEPSEPAPDASLAPEPDPEPDVVIVEITE